MFTKKFFWPKTFYDSKLSDQKVFPSQNFFGPKVLFDMKFVSTNFEKLQAKSLDKELTLFYPCYKNNNKKKNPHQNLNWSLTLKTKSCYYSVFLFFLRHLYFSKKEFLNQKTHLIGAPKTLRLDPFSDPVGHFGAPWWSFWILQTLQVVRKLNI